ncbi:hypothetical protein B0H17DRAFT_1130363 [Mycena rosella]|uniref:Uncharacterized protein n=1 Tax=Mycena rosella TaxID=1033263 RepID=A0AAD7DRE4_MYCRO|nr:hypothetical protein B0H17DRAFT_1130363 [Mycena rosella]
MRLEDPTIIPSLKMNTVLHTVFRRPKSGESLEDKGIYEKRKRKRIYIEYRAIAVDGLCRLLLALAGPTALDYFPRLLRKGAANASTAHQALDFPAAQRTAHIERFTAISGCAGLQEYSNQAEPKHFLAELYNTQQEGMRMRYEDALYSVMISSGCVAQ